MLNLGDGLIEAALICTSPNANTPNSTLHFNLELAICMLYYPCPNSAVSMYKTCS